MWKSVGNLYKVRLEIILALRHRVSSELGGILMRGVAEERVRGAGRPNICG
jgi:hypothetical protein